MDEVIERGGTIALAARQGVGWLLDRVATGFTMLGGPTFCALIVMSIVSIVGRSVDLARVPLWLPVALLVPGFSLWLVHLIA